MKCLSCGAELNTNLVQAGKRRISYDMCPECGSLWLDAGELDQLAFQVEGSIEFCSQEEAEDVVGPKRNCPRCREVTLDKVRFLGCSDIVLDRCGNCGGFWLEGGELELINRELASIMPVKSKGFSEFIGNVHLPHWRKRVRREGSGADLEAGVPPLRDAELRSEMTSVCPACGNPLNLYAVYGIEIEGCPACKGIWLDTDELRKLKDRSERGSWLSLRWLDDEVDAIERSKAMPSGRLCPRCEDQKLVSTAFGGSHIIVDWCPACRGVWLDGGEFHQILSHLRKKLEHMSPAEVRDQVYEEIKEIWKGPEDKISEILDARAAIAALINITVFQHPRLCELLMRFSDAARSVGL